jgi:PEP-CTERM motif
MLTQRRSLLAALCAIAVVGSAYSARALSIELIATPFTGNDTSVRILLDDTGGNLSVTLTVNQGLADLRGFFINVKDASLFSGVSVLGDDVTDFETGEVINLKYGNNLNGGGTPCPCDLGVTIGTPGIGKDDFSTTKFVIDAKENLTLEDFAGELIGVRVTSVGVENDRGGSAKLVVKIPDPLPVPEPSTALLLALGAAGLGYAGRLRR